MFSVRFTLLCLAATLTPSLAVCPSASFIKPCSCKNTHFGSLVLCSRISDAQPIRFAMNVLESYTVGTFTWQQVNIQEPLPAEFFLGVTVELFRIVDSQFSFSPDHLPFAGLESSLLRLDLTSSQVNFAGMHLQHLELLGEINVEKHNLSVVRSEWIRRYPSNLRVLRLEQCEITSLEPNVFKPLYRLKLLSLAKNKITHLERNMLPDSVRDLQTLDLNNNLLTDLPPLFFQGMNSLRRVYLFQNQITQIPFNPWALVWDQLERLWLNENPINCTDDVKWICYEPVPSVLEGTCTAPSTMVGVRLSMLTDNLFD